MNPIKFTKMSGCGNDFMVIDNRGLKLAVADMPQLVKAACRRRMAVGADGIIFIDDAPHSTIDFQWHFFNSDGSRAEMCGNGARCAARYAYLNQIAGDEIRFQTDVGPIEARMEGEGVRIKMTDPTDFDPRVTIKTPEKTYQGRFINTGVPHLVLETDQLETLAITDLAPPLRYHDQFAPAGTNVNFVQQLGDRHLRVRTYERGVEDETLACGTGVVATALVIAHKRGWESPLVVQVQSGGTLTVRFDKTRAGFENIFLSGDARIIYEAQLHPEALL